MKFILVFFAMAISFSAMSMVFKCTGADGDQFIVETWDFKEARARFVFCEKSQCTNSATTSWLKIHGNSSSFYIEIPKFPDVPSDPSYPPYPMGRIVITIGGGVEWQGYFTDPNFEAGISNAQCGLPTPLGFGW